MGLPVRQKSLAEEFGVDRGELGRADTLRYNVITFVVEENYERAVQELKEFMFKESEFPKFKDRIERYIPHAVDLINAIRAKRKFPGASSLTMAKQQELNDKFRQHFNELQQVLKNIERIHAELKQDDIRSTVWVVKALINSVFVIAIIAFFLEGSKGLYQTFWVVTDDMFLALTDWLFSLF